MSGPILLGQSRVALRRVDARRTAIQLPWRAIIPSSVRHFSQTPSRHSGLDPECFFQYAVGILVLYTLLKKSRARRINFKRLPFPSREELEKGAVNRAVLAGAFKTARVAAQPHEALRKVCFSVVDLQPNRNDFKDVGPLPSLPFTHTLGGKGASFDPKIDSRIFIDPLDLERLSAVMQWKTVPEDIKPGTLIPQGIYVAINADLGFGGKTPDSIKAFQKPYQPIGPKTLEVDNYLRNPDTFRQAWEAFVIFIRDSNVIVPLNISLIQIAFRETTVIIVQTRESLLSGDNPNVMSVSKNGYLRGHHTKWDMRKGD